MTVEIPTYKYINETQSIDFSSSNICTFIGKNGSGKSTLLESIFKNNRDKNIISFSSGQNELFTTIYEDIKNSTFKQLNKIGADFQNIKKYHFDSNWVRTLIFFATSMKNGLVRTYLKENSYIEINSLNDLTSKLKLKFEIPQYYIDAYQNAIEKESLEPDFMSVRRTYIQQYIEKIIENKINDTYDFEEKIAKQTIEIKAEDVLLLFDNDSFKVFTFISLANKASKPIFSYKSAKLYFKDNLEFEQLSDGEYQLLAIYALIDLFDNENTIFLFDEIDSHLHYSNINKLWSKLKTIDGKIITTTHSSETILQNNFDSLTYIESGKIEQDMIAEKVFKKLAQVTGKRNYQYKIASKIKYIALLDDDVDWLIFKKLAIKKLNDDEVENILNQVVPYKRTSSYNDTNEVFGKSKLKYVVDFKENLLEGSITQGIFLICDRDKLSLTEINENNLSVNINADFKAIKKFNNNQTFTYLHSWRMLEIENYLLSKTMLESYSKLDILQSELPQVNFDGLTSLDESEDIRTYDAKDILHPLYKENGFDESKLDEIIDKIPPEEISEDIVKMYNFIKSKVEG
ncbi:MAG: AAA family ATPase [Sulfurovum sp.]|nr:AAA family ATPase [Sulfurovum sp.]